MLQCDCTSIGARGAPVPAILSPSQYTHCAGQTQSQRRSHRARPPGNVSDPTPFPLAPGCFPVCSQASSASGVYDTVLTFFPLWMVALKTRAKSLAVAFEPTSLGCLKSRFQSLAVGELGGDE